MPSIWYFRRDTSTNYPLLKLVPAGTSALQGGALHLFMFCCTRPEAQTGPLWPLCLLLVHPTQVHDPTERAYLLPALPKVARSLTSGQTSLALARFYLSQSKLGLHNDDTALAGVETLPGLLRLINKYLLLILFPFWCQGA